MKTRCLDCSVLSPVPPTIAPMVIQLQGNVGERREGRGRVSDMRGGVIRGGKESTLRHSDAHADADGDGDGDGQAVQSPPIMDDSTDSVSAHNPTQHRTIL